MKEEARQQQNSFPYLKTEDISTGQLQCGLW